MVEYKTRHVTPNGVVMDDYHFENGVTITLIPCKEINEVRQEKDELILEFFMLKKLVILSMFVKEFQKMEHFMYLVY